MLRDLDQRGCNPEMRAAPLVRGLSTTAAALGLLLATGCATFAPPPRVASEPSEVVPAPFAKSHPLALVLSGGSARGFAHIGVLKVLEQNGIQPDLIVGSSAGSIVGGLYASGRTAAEVDRALAEMSPSVFRDIVLPGLVLLPGELGLVKGEKLRAFIRDRLRHERIEEFPIRFAAAVTDLQTGAAHAFNAGDASVAIRASSAVPGILTPVEMRGRYYGDGQISSPLPVAIARRLGAKVVIAVDVIYPPQDALLSSAPGVVLQAFTIAMNRLRDYELRDADIVIQPDIPPTMGQFGLSARPGLIAAGEKAAREALPKIREALRMRR